MKATRKTERGIALLATMMAVVLMTIVVMDFTTSAALGYRAAANQANEMRADYLARSGVQVGLSLIAQDSKKDADAGGDSYDGLDEAWAQPFPPLPVAGGFASVSIVDEERKLYLNQLVNTQNGNVNPDFAAVLTRLFQIVGVSPNVLPAIADWLDADSVPSGSNGAEADYYLHLVPPYEPRNGPMPTIGDLRLIKGIDDATFFKLSQFLTVTAQPAMLIPVNVNTAPPEVLAALLPDLDMAAIKEIVAKRMEQPFHSAADMADLPQQPPGFTWATKSEYFTITGRGSYAGARKLVFATIHRANGPGPVQLLDWHEN